ncbi:MAG TPA: APC family permease [Gaiellaceae bacterium]|nr:APC family permease [Gaiellaceae bacterium]
MNASSSDVTVSGDSGARMSVRGAAFIGIGSMVGAGIFALLGEAAVTAGSAVWLSFLLAGLITMLLAYNVVKLGIRYPSQGGLIEYLRQGFGNGRLLGVASWLGYAAAFVVVAGMLAVSFGSYATTLFIGDGAWSGWDNLFASLVIVAMTLVNMTGATFVARIASVMVVVLLVVFTVFIVVTISDVNFDLLAFSGYPSFSKIVASIALTFFAFLGFGVMTFTVANLRDPERELPKAVALALGLTTATYVLISIGVFGTLTADQAIGYGETAIAEAARPTLGDAGFTLMAVAALIATAGATNGTLFGSASLTASLAELRQFPPLLGPQSRLGKHGGLLVTAILALLLANFVNLSAIASVGSACSLVVFLLVGIAGYRLRSNTGASAAIVLLGIAATAIVLGFFAVDTLRNAPETFGAIVAMTLLAFGLDVGWKWARDRPAGVPSTAPRTGSS